MRPLPRWDPKLLCHWCFHEFERPADLEPWIPATHCPACRVDMEAKAATKIGRRRERRMQRRYRGTLQIQHPALCEVPEVRVRVPGEPGWKREGVGLREEVA